MILKKHNNLSAICITQQSTQ